MKKITNLGIAKIVQEEYNSIINERNIILEGVGDWLKVAGASALTYFLTTKDGREKLAQVLEVLPEFFKSSEDYAETIPDAHGAELDAVSDKANDTPAAFALAAQAIRALNDGDIKALVGTLTGQGQKEITGPEVVDATAVADDVDIAKLNPFLAGGGTNPIGLAESIKIQNVIKNPDLTQILVNEAVQFDELVPGAMSYLFEQTAATTKQASGAAKQMGALAARMAQAKLAQTGQGGELDITQPTAGQVGQKVPSTTATTGANVSPTTDSKAMFEAIDGLGTDDDAVDAIMTKRARDLDKLYHEYTATLIAEKEVEDGDLIQWLIDDGREDAAAKVSQAITAKGIPRALQMKSGGIFSESGFDLFTSTICPLYGARQLMSEDVNMAPFEVENYAMMIAPWIGLKSMECDILREEADYLPEAGRWATSQPHRTGRVKTSWHPTNPQHAAPQRENRPLTTGELMALMNADMDDSSDYKMTQERLASMNYGNLTDEELAIVSGATS